MSKFKEITREENNIIIKIWFRVGSWTGSLIFLRTANEGGGGILHTQSPTRRFSLSDTTPHCSGLLIQLCVYLYKKFQ